MECKTLEYYDSNNQQVFKNKKCFDTLDEAIAVAKEENAKEYHINKVVAYKCKTCFKYHIGRNGKEIKEKDRIKLQKQFKAKPKKLSFEEALNNVKIVGFIDLSKIKY